MSSSLAKCQLGEAAGGSKVDSSVLSRLLSDLQLMLHSGLAESVDLFIIHAANRLSGLPLYHYFLTLQAEALHQMGQLEKAELTFKKALQFNKGSGFTPVLPKEDDFYCKLAVTQLARKNYQGALQSLLTIATEQRSLKVQVLLIQVNLNLGNSEVVNDIKELLRKVPLALEFILTMLMRGQSPSSNIGKELVAIVQKALVDLRMTASFFSWIVPWIKLKTIEHCQIWDKYTFQQLATEVQALSGTTAYLMATIATCQFNCGDYENARNNFAEARQKDPCIIYGMTKYALLLEQIKDAHNLDLVATKLMGINPDMPEALVALGYYCLANSGMELSKTSRVIYLAQKAILTDERCYDALLLKARALSAREVNKNDEAILHYRELLRYRPWCFEAHEGIVKCQLFKAVPKENLQSLALVQAFNAVKLCGKNARTFTLLARVFRKDPNTTKDKVHAALDKALEMDPKYIEAISLKVDVLINEKRQAEAINLLKSKLESGLQDAASLHDKLASIYTKCGRKDEALTHKSAYYSLCKMKEGDQQLRSLEHQMPSFKGSLGELSIHLSDDNDRNGSDISF